MNTELDFLKSVLPGIGEQFFKPQPANIQIPYAIGFKPEAKPVLPVIPEPVKPVNKNFIDGATLKKILTHTSTSRCDTLAGLFNQILPLYGLDKADIFHEWVAQVAHESAEFSVKEENLRYSAERLRKIFPKYFPTDAIAAKYAMQPIKIANKAYANRNGNGNEASGDGWKFRGGGDIQLTGKAIYTAYALYKGKKVDEVADLVRKDDYYAIDSACWYFCIYKSLKDEAERDEFIKITKVVNGGLNGLDDREKYYERAKQFVK